VFNDKNLLVSLSSYSYFYDSDMEGSAESSECAASSVDESVEKLFTRGVAFIPSEHFLGSRNAYTFKLGDEGLGYYKDQTKSEDSKKTTKFVPKPPSGPPPPSAFEKKGK